MSRAKLPIPTRAAAEFPDQAAVNSYGIALTTAEAREVLCAMSILIARGRSRKCRAAYEATRLIVRAVQLSFVHNDVEVTPLCHLEDGASPPDGPSALRKLNITRPDITKYWHRARGYTDRCLPVQWVLAFVPSAAWPAVAAVIAAGPDACGSRFDELASVLAETERAGNDYRREERKRDPDGATLLLSTTVKKYLQDLWAFMECLKDLHDALNECGPNATLSADRISRWTHVPSKIKFAHGASRPVVATTAIPVERLKLELNSRLEELQSDRRKRTPIRMRRFLVLCLLPIMGERDYAFRNALVSDISAAKVWPDGSITPAITVYPGKTRDESEPFTRPITRRAWEYAVKPWLDMNGWVVGQRRQALFPGRDGTTPITSLNIGGRWKMEKTNSRGRIAALIPYSGESVPGRLERHRDGRISYDWGVATDSHGWPLTEPVNNPYRGYTAHAFRKRLHQTIGVVHRQLDKLEMIPDHLANVEAKHIKRAMTTHASGRTVDDTYDEIESLSADMCVFIAQHVEDYLWSGRVGGEQEVRRLGPDPEAIRAAREKAEATETAIDALTERIASSRKRKLHLREQKTQTTAQPDRARFSDEIELLSEEIEELNEQRAIFLQRWPDIKQAVIEAKQITVEIPSEMSDADWQRLVASASGSPALEEAVAGPIAGSLNLRRAGALLGVSESRMRQIYAETKEGRIPRGLRRILCAELPHEKIWDPHHQRYDRRLLVSALATNLDGSVARHLAELQLDQGLEDARPNGSSGDRVISTPPSFGS